MYRAWTFTPGWIHEHIAGSEVLAFRGLRKSVSRALKGDEKLIKSAMWSANVELMELV